MVDLRLKYGPDYYKDIRAKVESHPGGSFRDPSFAKQASAKGVAVRQQKAKNKRDGQDKDIPGRHGVQ